MIAEAVLTDGTAAALAAAQRGPGGAQRGLRAPVLHEQQADNRPSLAMLRRLGKTTVTPAGIDRFDVFVELTISRTEMENL